MPSKKRPGISQAESAIRARRTEVESRFAIQHQLLTSAAAGDVASVRASLVAGADPSATDGSGRTALHVAAHGTHTADRTGLKGLLAVMDLLLKSGCPLEAKNDSGKTALFTAAEFSPTVKPIQLLLDAGAQADVSDGHGNHILENALAPQVKRLLSRALGKPLPRRAPDPRDALETIPLDASQWRAAKKRLGVVFESLAKSGLVVLQDAGELQADGFDDCSEIFRSRGGKRVGLHGFCWYSGQDAATAKHTSKLWLAFWGAPKGAPKDMERVGRLIVETFQESGFLIIWDGAGGTRPLVYLQDAKMRKRTA